MAPVNANSDKKPAKGKRPPIKRKEVLRERLRPDEYEFCTKLAQRLPMLVAEREMGWPETYGYKVLARKHVARYMEKLKLTIEKREMADTAKQVTKLRNVTRAEVFARLAELMNMSPTDTNGTISGQVKAGETIAKMLGLMIERHADVTKDFEGRSEDELLHYAQHGKWPADPAERGEPGAGAEAGGA